jgi:superfamily I DNA and RNA helicase
MHHATEVGSMIKQLDEAISRLRELPEERQQAAAVLLLDFLEHDEDIELTAEQIAEIERRLAEDDIATDEEVRGFFERIK